MQGQQILYISEKKSFLAYKEGNDITEKINNF